MRSFLRFGEAALAADAVGKLRGDRRIVRALLLAALAGFVAAALALMSREPAHIVFTAWAVAFAAIVAAQAFAAGLRPHPRATTAVPVSAARPMPRTETKELCRFGRVEWRLVSVDHNWGTKQICVQLYLVAAFLRPASGVTISASLHSLSEHFGRQETRRHQWRAGEGAFSEGERAEIVLATIPKDPDMQGFCGGEFREDLLWIWAPSRHCFHLAVASEDGAASACRVMVDLPSRNIGEAAGPFSPFGGRLFVQEERHSPFDEPWTQASAAPNFRL